MADERSLGQRLLETYEDMPRGERRLADLLLENAASLTSDSATDLAKRAGVSKATTARFFRRLGYASFKEAQRQARVQGGPPAPRPPGGDDGWEPREGIALGTYLDTEVKNLVRTIELQRSDEVARAIRLLSQAEKLWVVGFGDNYPLAHFARAQLIKLRPDVRMIPIGGFSVPEEFASISSSDVMLACGVGRRTRALGNVVRSSVAAGAKVILVADTVSGADMGSASVVLRCRSAGWSLFGSWTAAVSLLTYVCVSLAARIGYPAIERLRVIEGIHADWGEQLEPES